MITSKPELNSRLVRLATQYSQDEETLVIPEDLTAIDTNELEKLRDNARAAFDSIYGEDGSGISEEDLATLQSISEGIDAIRNELTAREEVEANRRAAAQELAERVMPVAVEDQEPVVEDETDVEESGDDANSEVEDASVEVVENEPVEALAASADAAPRRAATVATIRRRQPRTPEPESPAKSVRDVARAAANAPNYSAGASLDLVDMGKIVDSYLGTFPQSAYAVAARQGRALRQRLGVATIHKTFSRDRVIDWDDRERTDRVLAEAANEKALPGGSLIASGGWGAPSETMYDLFELETSTGLVDLPEVGVARGGIVVSPGPDFADIFGSTGFIYTEDEDIAGDYDGEGGGSKPCHHIAPEEFVDYRMELAGLCLTAGLLQRRGHPESIARFIRGALVAHRHRLSGAVIGKMVDGSTAVDWTADQVGTTAPILTAIGLQVDHYRSLHRMAPNATLEAVFPQWTRGAIRADLSRRLGVDLLSVPDARIDEWFTQRGIRAQFVYNWQDLGTTAASGMVAYPNNVEFLLYAAGTWVKGASDVINLDTVYDSTLLGTNDYTALFTEEGFLVAKRGHDSRKISVPICTDGGANAGTLIGCDGAAVSV